MFDAMYNNTDYATGQVRPRKILSTLSKRQMNRMIVLHTTGMVLQILIGMLFIQLKMIGHVKI